MAYERQTFESGQVLTAQCMNKIDEWLAYICAKEITAAEINDKGELVFTLCNGSTLSVGVFSHSKLAEKDSSDQHPISAITGLSEALEKAIDETELQSAIEDALALAKESGEFDGDPGADGTSVTVKSVSESSSDGGNNVVTFSDGNTLVVKNGTKGTKGDKGDKGDDGTGVTILGSYSSESELRANHPTGSVGDSYLVEGSLYVWSETTNDWANVGNIKGEKGDKGETGENGTNGVSCTHSWNGTTLTVSSASGTSSANLKGEKGADGKTPVKGTDYYTSADKTEMVNLVLAALPTWTGGSY